MSNYKKTSKISGFYKLPIKDRIEIVKKFSDLSEEEINILSTSLDLKIADRMIENVLGTFDLPIGLALNFLINGKDYIIPMVTEESSVVAAASNAAKIARIKGGFITDCSDPLMIGQIQILNLKDIASSVKELMDHKKEILKIANSQDKILNELKILN